MRKVRRIFWGTLTIVLIAAPVSAGMWLGRPESFYIVGVIAYLILIFLSALKAVENK